MKTHSFTNNWLFRPLAAVALMAGLSVGQVANAVYVDNTGTYDALGGNQLGPNSPFAFAGLSWGTYFPFYGGDGSITTDDAYAVTIKAASSPANIYTAMYTEIIASGIVSFDYIYDIEPGGAPLYNPAYFLDNVGYNPLAVVGSLTHVEFAVTAGALNLGYFLGGDGSGLLPTLAITNFCYSGDGTCDFGGNPDINPVPVPPAFLLFGTAIAGMGLFRRKRQAKV